MKLSTCSNESMRQGVGEKNQPLPRINSCSSLKKLGVLSLIAACMLSGASVAYAESSERSPLYLYLGEDGGAYTFRANGNTYEMGYSISRHPVSSKEIENIRRQGYEVMFVREPGVSVKHPEFKSVSIPEFNSMPTSFSLMHWFGVVYGGFYIQNTGGAGKNTHWFNTTFRYKHLNTSSFNGHLAMALIADTDQLLFPHPPAMAPQGVGNGIVLGNVSLNANGCGHPPSTIPIFNIQVESFWNGGNALYNQTCYPYGLTEDVNYLIDLHANRAGYVTYTITPGGYGGMSWISPTASTASDRPSGRPGALSGNGFIVTLIPGPNPFEFIDFIFNNTYNGWF